MLKSAWILAALGTVLLTPHSARAGSSFSDAELADADWQLIVLTDGPGGTSTATQIPSDGNPDEHRQVTLVLNPPVAGQRSRVVSLHLRAGASHDPRLEGAIDSIEYSQDAIGIDITGIGMRTTPLVMQNGNAYVAPGSLVTQSNWTTASMAGLMASDFHLIRPEDLSTDPSSHPDFSANGAPLRFGFMTSSSTGTDPADLGFTMVIGFDNWSMTVVSGALARCRVELDQCLALPPGDLSGDGRVNVLDSALLRRTLAGLVIEFCGDGTVQVKRGEECEPADDRACPGLCIAPGLLEGCQCRIIACAHDRCSEGVALDPRCDACVARICEVDPFCCTNAWDRTCVAGVSSQCELNACAQPRCGDGLLNQASEECDPPEDATCTGLCQPDCTCTSLQWWETCGAPVCPVVCELSPSIRTCAEEQAGVACASEGDVCDAGLGCCAVLLCAANDPRSAGCPISRAEHKVNIRYLDDTTRRSIHDEVVRMRLATYNYAEPLADGRTHLGFMIDDNPMSPAVLPTGERVDLYGFTSMAVATLQVHAEEIEAMAAKLADLESVLAEIGTCEP